MNKNNFDGVRIALALIVIFAHIAMLTQFAKFTCFTQHLDPIARLALDPLAYSFFVVYLCTAACKNLNIGKYGDISYGMYLYHFPVIQFLLVTGVYLVSAHGGRSGNAGTYALPDSSIVIIAQQRVMH